MICSLLHQNRSVFSTKYSAEVMTCSRKIVGSWPKTAKLAKPIKNQMQVVRAPGSQWDQPVSICAFWPVAVTAQQLETYAIVFTIQLRGQDLLYSSDWALKKYSPQLTLSGSNLSRKFDNADWLSAQVSTQQRRSQARAKQSHTNDLELSSCSISGS